MGRPKITDGTPIALRLDAPTRERLEALQTTLIPGVEVPLSQVVRAVLVRGLDAMVGKNNDRHTNRLQAGRCADEGATGKRTTRRK